MQDEKRDARQVIRLLRFVCLLLVIVLSLSLGAIFWLDMANGPGSATVYPPSDVTLRLGAADRQEVLLGTVPLEQFNLRVTTELLAGDPDFQVGVQVNEWAVVISPLGYAGILAVGRPASVAPMPLQPWPHINPAAAGNEIWLIGDSDTIDLFVNRERLWTGRQSISESQVITVTLFVETFAHEATVQLRQDGSSRQAFSMPAAP